MTISTDSCVLDECRFFDAETGEWGYVVACLAVAHKDQTCPAEHEMFRYKP